MKDRKPFFYLFVFLSGAAGLIYQVAWHKYLAILLGAQARATAAVLAIFLGGISAGYWLFGRWTRRKAWNLLLVYALVELGLGFWAFIFPHLFHGSMAVLPRFYRVFGVNNIAVDIFFSVALLGFPTFLMGGTLPLLTQGLSEDLGSASRTHARIYGFNTVGACFGCLLAGYVLIPMTDLGITVTLGGMLNIAVAVLCYFIFARNGKAQSVNFGTGRKEPFTRLQIGLLVVGFCSGFYILTLGTVFIRLMGLSTGSSNYNFTLIVSIFILGLGIGSLLVRNISDYKISRLFWNQVWVGMGLLIVYFSGDYWSYWVHVIRATLRDIPQNFYFFQFLLGALFFAILIIPVGLCGLTLPLCFHLMKDSRESLGQRVGELYGLNSVGSVLGAVVGGYLILDYVDLDSLFKICIGLSLVSAIAIALIANPFRASGVQKAISLGICALSLVLTVIAPSYSHDRWIQPFRHPQPVDATWVGAKAFGDYLSRNTKLIHWDDGPNTSLGVGSSEYNGKEISRTIFVNGKSDGNTRGDYLTTIMLAHIPGMLARKLSHACVIGFGTGITIGTLSLYPEVETIDVAEISNTIIKNRHYYDPYNGEVSKNKKVEIHEMDAFRYFGGTDKLFDVIISEPSNPWVAGIENLYSLEFYKTAREKLTEGGLFVQWIHTYSFTDELMQMVLATMTKEFPYTSVFQLKGGDLALVGTTTNFTHQDLQRGAERIEQSLLAKANLTANGFDRPESILALELVPALGSRGIAANGDLHQLESPRLSNGAVRAFFSAENAGVASLRRKYKEFYAGLGGSLLSTYMGGKLPSWETTQKFQKLFCDEEQTKTRALCEETMALARMLKPGFDPNAAYKNILPERELASFQRFQTPPKAKFDAKELQSINILFNFYKRYASPIAHLPLGPLIASTDYCLGTVPRSNELYGECLIQKVLMLDASLVPTSQLISTINQYLEWFPSLSKSSENYGKLKEAQTILVRMAGLHK